MKKKKKKSSKKIDLEAFEKELNESKAKDAADDEGDDGEGLAEIDEAELGDDPFARSDAPTGVDAGTELWLKSDRDYTYPEVNIITNYISTAASNKSTLTASTTILRLFTRLQSITANINRQALHNSSPVHS